MKAIIYAGIGLFTVASVYGVADYYTSTKNGELKKLYAEEKPAILPATADEKKIVIIPAKNAETTPAIETNKFKAKSKSFKKAKKIKKVIRFDDFSRGRIKEPVIPDEKITEKKN